MFLIVALAFSENKNCEDKKCEKEDCVKLEHLFEYPEFPGSARRVNYGRFRKIH